MRPSRRREVHARARAPQPDRRRRDRRIPISSAVRAASHVSRRPADNDRATAQSDNASAAVHSASVRRSVSDDIFVVINRDSSDCRRFSVLPLVTPPGLIPFTRLPGPDIVSYTSGLWQIGALGGPRWYDNY